jgi:hypothetical protein
MWLCDRAGIDAVRNTGLIIDPLLFVELIAEPVARPLQLLCQTGLTVANRPVCKTRELHHDRTKGARLSPESGRVTDLVRCASPADAAMPARSWNVIVAAVAAVAVLGGGASLRIGASAQSVSVAQALQKGTELCGWMGVQVSPMTTPFAESLGMAKPYGAIFEPPEPGSPAAATHIEAINGSPLMRSSDFAGIISMMAPGTSVYLNAWRDRQAMQVTVILGSAPCRTRG